MDTKIDVVGVYRYPLTPQGLRDAHVAEYGEYFDHLDDPAEYVEQYGKDLALIEITVSAKDEAFDPGGFTQAEPGQPMDNWQVAYDEKFLNDSGTEIIDEPAIDEPVRFAFYLHQTKFAEPLLTPYGEVALPPPLEVPERLRELFKYIPP